MQLSIRRDQAPKKGILGGHKGMEFMLSARLTLTPEEQDLVKQYKAGEERISSYDSFLSEAVRDKAIKVESGNPIGVVSVNAFQSQQTFRCRDVFTLLKVEDDLKQSCENLKVLLEVMRSFGGEEVVEF